MDVDVDVASSLEADVLVGSDWLSALSTILLLSSDTYVSMSWSHLLIRTYKIIVLYLSCSYTSDHFAKIPYCLHDAEYLLTIGECT